MKAITLNELAELACKYGLELADIQAVYEVEAAGKGFLNNGHPKILFERHWFSKFTNRPYDRTSPDISSTVPGGYKGGLDEWDRFNRAQELNRDAAIRATSWGVGQVMGEHYKKLGFKTPQDFLNANFQGEKEQFNIMLKFISQNSIIYNALKRRDWKTFAKYYNGPDYAKNKYDTKLAAAHSKFSKLIA